MMRKETEAMQIFKSKLLLILTTLAFILAFSVTTSTAQEKVKINSKYTGVFTKMEQMKPDDTEGHTLSSYEAKGAGMGASGGFTFFSQGMSDLVKGNGTNFGYAKTTDKDGHVLFSKSQGKVSTTQSPEGRPIVKFGGTWSFTKGTGKWENVEGGGTYKGWFIGQDIFTNTTEGEYFIKK
jgi:hypothetical protein